MKLVLLTFLAAIGVVVGIGIAEALAGDWIGVALCAASFLILAFFVVQPRLDRG